MTADDLDGQGIPECKPHWGCGAFFMGVAFMYLLYRGIMWLSTQTS
jgi:hypothetical protein